MQVAVCSCIFSLFGHTHERLPMAEPSDPEKILWELKPLFDELMDDADRNQRVFEAAERALGRIAREHYPHMGNWPGEQLRELNEIISRTACRFCIDVSNVD